MRKRAKAGSYHMQEGFFGGRGSGGWTFPAALWGASYSFFFLTSIPTASSYWVYPTYVILYTHTDAFKLWTGSVAFRRMSTFTGRQEFIRGGGWERWGEVYESNRQIKFFFSSSASVSLHIIWLLQAFGSASINQAIDRGGGEGGARVHMSRGR